MFVPFGKQVLLCCVLLLLLRSHIDASQESVDNERLDDDDDPCKRRGSSCADCTEARFQSGHDRPKVPCVWCPFTSTCSSKGRANEDCITKTYDVLDQNNTNTSVDNWIYYSYDCPLGPTPYPDTPPAFLPHWMQTFLECGLLEQLLLTDLSMPGTHDSLSYDLSLTVAEDGIDHFHELADLLHRLSRDDVLLPGDLEDFCRWQAKTQQLSLVEQLDNGIRFIDFRLMLDPQSNRWYSLHFMQSRHSVEYYWNQLREWLDKHPNEIVLLWLSRHGDPSAVGNDQYPGVPVEEKQRLWDKFTTTFTGLLLDTRVVDIGKTSVAKILRDFPSHRLVVYATDYAEFTNHSAFALDAAHTIKNRYDAQVGGVFDEPSTMSFHKRYFQHARSSGQQFRKANTGGITILGMNSASQGWQLSSSVKRRFIPWFARRSCSAHWRPVTPNSRIDWCPDFLLDISQLSSYYNQVTLEYVVDNYHNRTLHTAFPNVLYVDALDVDGTIRTGSQLLNGIDRSGTDDDDQGTKDARYAFVDAILWYNLQEACRPRKDRNMLRRTYYDNCTVMEAYIQQRRRRYPVRLWNEPSRGRFRFLDRPFAANTDSVL